MALDYKIDRLEYKSSGRVLLKLINFCEDIPVIIIAGSIITPSGRD